MRCEELEKELVAFSDGELDAAAHESVVAHLEECSACKTLVADLSVISKVLREREEVPPSAGFASRLREELEVLKSGTVVGQQLLPFPALAAAALVVGIVLGGQIFSGPVSDESGLARTSSRLVLELNGFKGRSPNSLSLHLERFLGGVR